MCVAKTCLHNSFNTQKTFILISYWKNFRLLFLTLAKLLQQPNINLRDKMSKLTTNKSKNHMYKIYYDNCIFITYSLMTFNKYTIYLSV